MLGALRRVSLAGPVSRRRVPRPTRLDMTPVRGRVHQTSPVHMIAPMSHVMWDRPHKRSPERAWGLRP
jgi:hypothetical protein